MASVDSGTSWGDALSVRRVKSRLCAEDPPPIPHVDYWAMPIIHVGDGVAGAESKWLEQEGDYSTMEGNEVPLKVVYWNVAGIPARDIDSFLGDLYEELQWDILILFEFSVARRELLLSGVRQAGHLVAAQPFANGRRAGALVFCIDACRYMISPWFHTAGLWGRFQLGRLDIRIIGGHADANGDRAPIPA